MVDGLQSLNLHPYLEQNEWVWGYFVCRKSNEQVTEETVVEYLHQTAQPDETVRDRQLKGSASIDGIQTGVFTFIAKGVL